ncbi:MAG: hypothetical protein ABIJ09_06885 [Pseudomonadota bacterium]
MKRRRGLVLLPALLLAAPSLAQDDDMTFGALEVEVKSVEREKYEEAVKKTKSNQCDGAIFDFFDLMQNEKAKEFHEGSEYYVAKCLYRLGLYHASLHRFAKILEKGEKGPYFQTSREWLFFISRKVQDQEAVLDVIAKYADKGGVPENYADEFHFLLGKYYYLMGLGDLVPDPEAGRASEAEQKAKEDKAKEDDEKGFDFGADEAGGGGGDVAAAPGSGGDFDFDLGDLDGKPKKKKTSKPKPKPKAKPDDDGSDTAKPAGDEGMGFTIGDDSGEGGGEGGPAKDVQAYKRAGQLPAGEAMERAVQHLEQVPEGTKYYARARYLEGLVYYQRENYDRAVEAFRHVVRLTHPKTGAYKSPKLREMAFFSLARVHYGFKQFRYAIFYYDKISRNSEAWLDAIFESSWAYFRLGNYEKSLGNLITLHSPFFIDEYYPESLILKAVTYYENCRYPEARDILEEFETHYGGVRDELVKLTAESKTPEDYYKLLDDFATKEPSETNRLTLRMLRLALSDQGVKTLDQAVNEIEAEAERMGQVVPGLISSPLGDEIKQSLEARRQKIVERAGTILRDKLSAERDDLKSLSSQLFRIKFEIAKMEKEQIEAEMRGESLVVPLSEYLFSAAVDDEHEFYPFVGEYWRDELGTYEYTLTQGCRPESSE